MLLLVASSDCRKTLDHRKLRQRGANLAPQFLFAGSRLCRERYDWDSAICLPERAHRLPQLVARKAVTLGGHNGMWPSSGCQEFHQLAIAFLGRNVRIHQRQTQRQAWPLVEVRIHKPGPVRGNFAGDLGIAVSWQISES